MLAKKIPERMCLRRKVNALRWMSVVFAMAMVLCFAETGWAAGGNENVPELEEGHACSITINYRDENRKSSKGVGGVTISYFKVADFIVDDQKIFFRLKDDFAIGNINFDEMTASEVRFAAKSLYQQAIEKKVTILSGVTDKQGKVCFSELSVGVYLVVPQDYTVKKGGVYTAEPFLVLGPLLVKKASGKRVWDYDVIANPKAEYVQQTEPTPPPVVPVDTGDTSRLHFWIGCLAAAAILLFILCRWKRNRDVGG